VQPELRRRLRDRQDLGMGGRILGALDLIVGRGDHLAPVFDDAADGNFVSAPGVDGLIVGQTHVEDIIPHQLGRKALFKRAGGRERGLGWHKRTSEENLACGHGFGLTRCFYAPQLDTTRKN
jgi:hypothetical protein